MSLISTDFSVGLKRMLRVFRGLERAEGPVLGYAMAAHMTGMSYEHTVRYTQDLVARGFLAQNAHRFTVTDAGHAALAAGTVSS